MKIYITYIYVCSFKSVLANLLGTCGKLALDILDNLSFPEIVIARLVNFLACMDDYLCVEEGLSLWVKLRILGYESFN